MIKGTSWFASGSTDKTIKINLPIKVCLTSNFLLAHIITASSSPQLAKFPSWRL